MTMGTCGGSSRGLRGPTGGGWPPLTPSGPSPLRGSPPGQGGIQILAAATMADVAVVDVPVFMQHSFQQSLVLPQFINRVVAISDASQRQVRTALLCRRPLRFHSCSSWASLSCPSCATTSVGTDSAENCGIAAGAALVVLWTSLSSRTIQSDRVPDIPVMLTEQFLNKVVDASCARQLPMVQTVQLRSPTRSLTSLFSRSRVEVPQIQSSTVLNDNLEQ